MPVCGVDILKDPNYVGEAMSTEKVRQAVKEFASAAVRAKRVGYDSVDINGAHGVLVGNFLSPFYNLRTDWYGGSLERRMRFCLELIEVARRAVGMDYPILIRLSVDEMLRDLGNSVEDYTTSIVPRLVEAGVDCFDVSMGSVQHVPDGMFPSLYYRRGYFMYLAILNLRLLKNSELVAVDDDGWVTLKRKKDEREEEWKVQVDTLVISLGRKPNNALLADLKQEGIEALAIGDARNVREIYGAMEDARSTARPI